MRFVCSENYTQFWGYVFAYGKPTDVIDKATILRCRADKRFKEIPDGEEKIEEGREAQAVQMLDANACPKCGKVVRQGRFMHEKYCKG